MGCRGKGVRPKLTELKPCRFNGLAGLDAPAHEAHPPPREEWSKHHPKYAMALSPFEPHNVSQSVIPGNAVEEEKAAGEDVVRLVQCAEVQVGSACAAAVVDVQDRYWVKLAGSLLHRQRWEVGRPLFLPLIPHTPRVRVSRERGGGLAREVHRAMHFLCGSCIATVHARICFVQQRWYWSVCDSRQTAEPLDGSCNHGIGNASPVCSTAGKTERKHLTSITSSTM